MANQTWDLDALTLRQRDVLIELCNTNTGSLGWDPGDEPNHDLKLKAARELEALGVVMVDEDYETTVALTADGERWLLSLPEGALAYIGGE